MQLVHILFPVLFTIIFVIFILYMCGDRVVLIPVFLIIAIIVNLIGIAIIEKSAYADTEI